MVTGTITVANGAPLAYAVVDAVGVRRRRCCPFGRHDPGAEILLGAANTDANGVYQIQVTDDPANPRSHVRMISIQVSVGSTVVGTSNPVRKHKPQTIIDLRVDYTPPRHDYRVQGTVRDRFGALMTNVTVSAVDRDLRHEQPLGQCSVTDGTYEIRYSPSQFQRAEKNTADLVLTVRDAAGTTLYRSPVFHNAAQDADIDLSLAGVAYTGPSEWERQTAVLIPLLDGVSPLDLREDQHHQDVSFLVAETGYTALAIGVWTFCWRLADRTARDRTPLPPDAVFAFLHQGEPSIFSEQILTDFAHPERVVLIEDSLLRALSTMPTERHRALLTKAVDENMVPARLGADIDRLEAILAQIKLRYTADTTIGGGKGTIGELLAAAQVPATQQKTILDAISTHTGALAELWNKLGADPSLPASTVATVKMSVEVGSLTRNHVPMVAALLPELTSGRLTKRQLAQYSAQDWFAVFDQKRPDGTTVGVPANIDGDTPQQKRETYAAILDVQFERAYPTASLAAKILREDTPAPQLSHRVARFLDDNPKFMLDKHRIDHYLDTSTGDAALEVDPGLLADLASAQRVFKLRPTFTATNALLSEGIDSAQKIYFMGEGQFVAAVAKVPNQGGVAAISTRQARTIYRKAETTYAHALALFGDYNFAIVGRQLAALPQHTLDADAAAKIRTLPNLATLFGSLDYCDCIDCQSVYSPASHFVDVLRFLGARDTHGSGVNEGKTVREVLLERRPDLGDIELSCANTNTAVPYLDLVNEILEDAVDEPPTVRLNAAIESELAEGTISTAVLTELRAKGIQIAADAHVYAPDIHRRWVIRDDAHSYSVFRRGTQLRLRATRQTTGSTDEVRANPEHLNQGAYTTLAGEVFPFRLPFDLANEQARGYLAQLGVPQARLFELLQQRRPDGTVTPADVQIAGARLGIGPVELQILTGSLTGRQPWEFWGLARTGNVVPDPSTPTRTFTGTWLEVLAKVPVMLHRTGLSYRDLLQLLDMRFVNPDRAVFVRPSTDPNAANCDISQYTLRGLTAAVLHRIHRFVRLWRRLGSTMWEVDQLLTGRAIDDTLVGEIAALRRLQDRTGLDWSRVVTVFTGFDDHVYTDRSRGGGTAVQTVYQRLFRNRLVEATGTMSATAAELTGTIGEHAPGLLAGLRITESDLDAIVLDHTPDPDAPLDLAMLNHTHRVVALARGLGMRIADFLRLRRIGGIDPFTSPAAAVSFAELADIVIASPFSVAELDYVLTHHFTVNSGVALDDRAIVAFLTQLRQDLSQVSDRLKRTNDQPDTAYVTAQLGLLPTLAADTDLRAAQALADGSWTGSDGDHDELIDRYFGEMFDDLAAARTALAALPTDQTPEQRQASIDARFGFIAPKLEAYLVRTHKDLSVRQHIAAFLGLTQPSADQLVTALRLPGASTDLATVVNDARLVATDPDGRYTHPLDAATFTDNYRALRLLHKAAMIVAKLAMNPTEVAWWLAEDHAQGLGWIGGADLGVDAASTVPLDRWRAMHWFFDWRTSLPASDLTVLEFAEELLDVGSPSANTIAALSKLTASDAADLTSLATAFGWLSPTTDQVKQQLAKADNLRRVTDSMAMVRRLGVTASRAVGWAAMPVTPTVAEQVKQALKARYDLPQWLEVNRPVADALRERRREVLVDWLVAHPDPAEGKNWTDADGLYGYYLIDVQMSACAMTSRLKQATASVQQFVQRVLLGVEVDIIASTVTDPKWKQWQWMRRYRLWEANRKIFLYPENWIEPELRDEKSPFFLDLEHDLQQNDITADVAEDAYRNYLTKLDKVANLEIRARFEEHTGEDNSTLHVVGRTRSSTGAEYFYRRRINRGRWTAWQPMKLEIKSDHLMLGVHNRRLYALWPQFIAKAKEPSTLRTPSANDSVAVSAPDRYWDVQLFWSELKNGGWTPPVLSDNAAEISFFDADGDHLENITFRTRLDPQIKAPLFVTAHPDTLAPHSWRGFEKLGPQITQTPGGSEFLHSPPESRFHGNLIRHQTASQYFWHSSSAESSGLLLDVFNAHSNALSIRTLRKIAPNKTFTVLDSNASGFAIFGSFFTWDTNRSYFIDYAYWSPFRVTPSVRSPVLGILNAFGISRFRFFPHYHPFIELFIKELNLWGLKGLLNRQIQVKPATVPGAPTPFDFSAYRPEAAVPKPWPTEEVDFSYEGAYSCYNWELFFHAPMYIAGKLAANQRFEEALQWYHYVFDPTSTDNATPDPDTPQQKYWITKPFYETTKADYYQQKIENILLAIAKDDAELRKQVREWRNNPFNPHLIARMRTVAYQKNVLIKYIQTLIAWGDHLFAQDTIESTNEATQLYVLAATVLGPRPKSVPRHTPNPVRTFYQLQAEGIDDFGNTLRTVENLLPTVPRSGGPAPSGPELPRLDVLYFCIPTNDKLLTLWDTVDDRLFKLRHCMNLAGVVRQLPLFEPPIDPALLVKATAAGLDLGAALADISAPMPPYRFTALLQRAQQACTAVIDLGQAMTSALEKRDAETLAALRSANEITLLDVMRDVRVSQVSEAQANWDAAQHLREVVELRRAHHQRLADDGLNTGETTALGLSIMSLELEAVVAVGYMLSGGLKLIPSFQSGAAGFGGSPTVIASTGGNTIGNSAEMAAAKLRSLATAADKGAALAGVLAGHARRKQDWRYQAALAATELPEVDKQILTAQIRHTIAEQELRHHDKQRATTTVEDEFLHTKYTNEELYDWMVDQLSTVYFQSYQLAYDLAKRAERCFRYELGITDSDYIRYGYWDSLRKGLLSGERLSHDLRRLEAAYLEHNKREYELTKHVSLAQLDPIALLQLKRNGACFLDIPEAAFDLDHPGHYFRRLKAVSLSVPCVVGPYGTVGCTLTLVGDSLRKDATLSAGKYPRDPAGDTRFRDGLAAVQSIASSSGVNDTGMFELRFDDPRYLPFEGAGAISSWRLELNTQLPQFDPGTISDVVIHLQYTAREGGAILRKAALEDLDTALSTTALADGRQGLYRVLDLKREFPNEFYRFLHPANQSDEQTLELGDLADRLPYYTRMFTAKKIHGVEVAALMKHSSDTYDVVLPALGTAELVNLAPEPSPATYQGLHRAANDLTGNEATLTGWTMKVRKTGAADFKSLPDDEISELFLIVNYTLA
ncbi:neuraminidase-like domain-containing protein [Nocardia sp. NPDC127606]|uniref:Tc toxin subunit A-related protein n=1 Tax=Nocardia sp. NPDC127606 TaxID=3345406 RepID=UPI00362A62C1